MKTEDIDKKIGMPDVDAEWAKFEREVIGKKASPIPSERGKKSHKTVWLWGLGIAASIALLAGIFLLTRNTDEPKQQIAQQTTTTMQPPSAEENAIEATVESIASPEKPNIVETKQTPSSDLLAEAASPSTKETDYACGEIDPQYPGGERALIEFIKTNQRYPELAMECGARGRVIMSLLVDSTGYVSDIKPIKYLLQYDTTYMNNVPADRQVVLKEQIKTLMGEEGTRILSLMPQKWTPGSLFGKARPVRYNVPVTFNATDAERQTYLAQQDEALQGRIAGLNIVPTSSDIGPGNAMRIMGTDPNSMQLRGTQRDTILIIVNGIPLPDSLCTMAYFSSRLSQDLYRQGQLADVQSIIIYKDENNIKKYGERAKHGVVTLSTTTDTLCDAYVQKHPELKQSRRFVEGFVVDEKDQPLSDAWVNITPSTAGAATDSTGHFALWIPLDQKEVLAHCVGYVRVRKAISSDDSKLIFRLRNATTIKDVLIRVREKNDNEGKPIPVKEITTKDFNLQQYENQHPNK